MLHISQRSTPATLLKHNHSNYYEEEEEWIEGNFDAELSDNTIPTNIVRAPSIINQNS